MTDRTSSAPQRVRLRCSRRVAAGRSTRRCSAARWSSTAPESEIWFDSALLGYRSPRWDPDLLQLHEELADKRLSNLKRQDLIERHPQGVLAAPGTGQAATWRMSPRNWACRPRRLRFELSRAGTSFSQVLADFRYALARKLLAHHQRADREHRLSHRLLRAQHLLPRVQALVRHHPGAKCSRAAASAWAGRDQDRRTGRPASAGRPDDWFPFVTQGRQHAGDPCRFRRTRHARTTTASRWPSPTASPPSASTAPRSTMPSDIALIQALVDAAKSAARPARSAPSCCRVPAPRSAPAWTSPAPSPACRKFFKHFATFGVKKRNIFQEVSLCWRELQAPVICRDPRQLLRRRPADRAGRGYPHRHAGVQSCAVMEVKWGLIPDMSGTVLLRELMSLDVAKELTLTGRVVSGSEAQALGSVTRLSDDPQAAARRPKREIINESPDACLPTLPPLQLAMPKQNANWSWFAHVPHEKPLSMMTVWQSSAGIPAAAIRFLQSWRRKKSRATPCWTGQFLRASSRLPRRRATSVCLPAQRPSTRGNSRQRARYLDQFVRLRWRSTDHNLQVTITAELGGATGQPTVRAPPRMKGRNPSRMPTDQTPAN